MVEDAPPETRTRGSMGRKFNAMPSDQLLCGGIESFEWVCGLYGSKDGSCSPRCGTLLDQLRLDVSTSPWRPTGLAVKHCYAKPTPERCRLKFNLAFCVVVTVMNLVKALLILVVFLKLRPVANNNMDEPLLTIGDAIASFLQFPDSPTASMCLATQKKTLSVNPPRAEIRRPANSRTRSALGSALLQAGDGCFVCCCKCLTFPPPPEVHESRQKIAKD